MLLPGQAAYASIRCEFMPDNKTEETSQPYLSGNSIYNPAGKTGVCGHSLAEWQAMGNDPGTTVHGPIPQAAGDTEIRTAPSVAFNGARPRIFDRHELTALLLLAAIIAMAEKALGE